MNIMTIIKIPDFLYDAGICESKGEAKRLIDQGGIRISNIKIIPDHIILSDGKGMFLYTLNELKNKFGDLKYNI